MLLTQTKKDKVWYVFQGAVPFYFVLVPEHKRNIYSKINDICAV